MMPPFESGPRVDARRPSVVVLGMHRSGTSLTARLLRDLGWFLGDEAALLGPRDDNPDGFFERADVQTLNDQLLADLDASWDAPPAEGEVAEVAASRHDDVQQLVDRLQDGAGAGAFALKDPRLCVLWPAWSPCLPSVTPVLVFRDPVEVALSLRHRDGLPLLTGLALWEVHVTRSLRICAGRHTVVVRYGDVVAEPQAATARLAVALGVELPDGAGAAVRHELHRQRAASGAGVVLSPSQARLWSFIRELPDRVDRFDAQGLDDGPETPAAELLDERRALVRSRRAWTRAEADTRSQADDLVERLEADNRRIHAMVKDLDSERERWHAEVVDAGRRVEEASAARQAAEARADAADRRVEKLRQELAADVRAARLEVNQTVAHLSEAEAALTAERADHAATTAERDDLGRVVEALRKRRLEQADREERLMDALDEERAVRQAATDESAALHRRVETLGVEMAAEADGERRAVRVAEFERDNLIHAVTTIEGQRRLLEERLRAVEASRIWRWGRRLAGPLGESPPPRGRGQTS